MNTEPTIQCQNCRAEIKRTESLAVPLIAATRQQYEQSSSSRLPSLPSGKPASRNSKRLSRRKREALDTTVASKLRLEREKLQPSATSCSRRGSGLAEGEEGVDAAIAEKLELERAKIAADEAKKAKLALGNDIEQKAKEIAEFNLVLKSRDEKLVETQQAHAELVKQSRELDDAKREIELTIENRISESLGKTREQAKKEAEEAISLKLVEKEQTIASMQQKIEELKKKAEQGSQQLQGEALELQLESVLAGKFPHDTVTPVPKGEHGGDIVQRVMMATGVACGIVSALCRRCEGACFPSVVPIIGSELRRR